MGVSFSYETYETISADVKNVIIAEAEGISRGQVTTEPIVFFSSGDGKDQLMGYSKIFPDAMAEYVPVPRVRSDARFIIDTLSEWSSRFNISWRITAQAADVGMIQNGKPDLAVLGMVEVFEDPELWKFDL